MIYSELKYNSKVARRHHPDGYDTYQAYKPWLRDEFVFRCVYCLEREMWYLNRDGSFAVEHVRPKSPNPTLLAKYSNLVYSCNRCNSWKRKEECINPIDHDMSLHLKVEADGCITGLTQEGKDIIMLLHLNEDPALANRKNYINIIEMYRGCNKIIDSRITMLYKNLFRYPDNMEDLTLLRPPINHNPNSMTTSFFSQKMTGTLADTY